jgi:hypothetical protein
MTSGLVVAEHTTPTESADGPPVDSSRRRRPWRALLAALVVAAALGYVASNEVRTDHTFDHTRQSLNATQQQLTTVQADLTQLRHTLRSLDGQAVQTKAALTSDFAQLLHTEVALAKSEGTVSSQGTTISTLQLCLGGVTQALNALSVGDQQTAIAALNDVSASCQSAVVDNG